MSVPRVARRGRRGGAALRRFTFTIHVTISANSEEEAYQELADWIDHDEAPIEAWSSDQVSEDDTWLTKDAGAKSRIGRV